jgi:hypothetical protein
MFRIPEKQIIVNNTAQIRILNAAGSGVYTDIATPATTDGFQLEGFLQTVLFGNLKPYTGNIRIKAEVAVAPVVQIATFTANAVTGNAQGEPFIIRYDSLDKTPTEFQNVPLEKHYQLSVNPANIPAASATAIQVATSIVAAINADKNAPVTAANGGTAVVTLTAKRTGFSFVLYPKPGNQGGLVTGTFAVTQVPTKGINQYDNLKNINWAKNLDFDRNVEYFPQYGATYKSYKFIIRSTPPAVAGSVNQANAVAPQSETEIQLWIQTGSSLITTMDLVVADANVALA